MLDPVSRYLHRSAGRHGPVMLMYHSVRPGNTPPEWPWAISIQQFRDQLDFLADAGYSTPTVEELIAAPPEDVRRAVAITFDDGYADNLPAFEALRERGMRATWYVVTNSLGHEPDWAADGRPVGRLLTPAELRQMRAAGMQVGSHGTSHRRLPELDDIALKHELTDSRASLADILGEPVSSFAYPYGAWDARSEQAVKDAGYASACLTRTGWALRNSDPYRIRRIAIFNTDTVSTLARKLSTASNDVSTAALARYARQRIWHRLRRT
jgi:peptidoglycan/xylan/chitin deacetylase (PgdA/CDA1 family)